MGSSKKLTMPLSKMDYELNKAEIGRKVDIIVHVETYSYII
jgi:hypothetical protein